MLQDFPDELAFRIINYLPTKDRLRLSIISHAWRDLCHNNHNWAEITINASADQAEGALVWLADLDDRADPTVKILKMDIWDFDPEDMVAPASESGASFFFFGHPLLVSYRLSVHVSHKELAHVDALMVRLFLKTTFKLSGGGSFVSLKVIAK